MSTARSRGELQKVLRAAIVTELVRLDLPDDGRHLGRVARALIREALELLLVAGIPRPAVAQLVVETTRKVLTGSSGGVVGALGQPLASVNA